MTFASAAAMVILFLVSLPAVVDYVTFMKVQRTAYLHIRFDWLFSIYILFAVAAIVRYLWIGWRAAVRRATGRREADNGGVGPMNFASPFSISIVAITALALFGLPIGYAMIAGSILYLMLVGQDLGTVAEQLLNGMYQSWILLAVPLFILAAEIMNSGTMTERLLRFCEAHGRAASAAGSRRSTSCRASSSPACRARRSPTRPARAG